MCFCLDFGFRCDQNVAESDILQVVVPSSNGTSVVLYWICLSVIGWQLSN